MGRFTGLLGLATMLFVAYSLSTNRRSIRWRTVAWGLGLQITFAFMVIKWPYGQIALHAASTAVTSMLGHAADGSSMVFGHMGTPGDPLSTFAFAVLPTIIFVSAFFALLYYFGVMQQVI
ncbi:MAG: Na+ dependent nucleoside transporter N-terminal domain-containing protein, partial [Acidobacteriaceae bacterium]|nr:Na+ dependent nucleoside transporter N-terminal domain-containing protein [Acidobacteriaceae bacterium]